MARPGPTTKERDPRGSRIQASALDPNAEAATAAAAEPQALGLGPVDWCFAPATQGGFGRKGAGQGLGTAWTEMRDELRREFSIHRERLRAIAGPRDGAGADEPEGPAARKALAVLDAVEAALRSPFVSRKQRAPRAAAIIKSLHQGRAIALPLCGLDEARLPRIAVLVLRPEPGPQGNAKHVSVHIVASDPTLEIPNTRKYRAPNLAEARRLLQEADAYDGQEGRALLGDLDPQQTCLVQTRAQSVQLRVPIDAVVAGTLAPLVGPLERDWTGLMVDCEAFISGLQTADNGADTWVVPSPHRFQHDGFQVFGTCVRFRNALVSAVLTEHEYDALEVRASALSPDGPDLNGILERTLPPGRRQALWDSIAALEAISLAKDDFLARSTLWLDSVQRDVRTRIEPQLRAVGEAMETIELPFCEAGPLNMARETPAHPSLNYAQEQLPANLASLRSKIELAARGLATHRALVETDDPLTPVRRVLGLYKQLEGHQIWRCAARAEYEQYRANRAARLNEEGTVPDLGAITVSACGPAPRAQAFQVEAWMLDSTNDKKDADNTKSEKKKKKKSAPRTAHPVQPEIRNQRQDRAAATPADYAEAASAPMRDDTESGAFETVRTVRGYPGITYTSRKALLGDNTVAPTLSIAGQPMHRQPPAEGSGAVSWTLAGPDPFRRVHLTMSKEDATRGTAHITIPGAEPRLTTRVYFRLRNGHLFQIRQGDQNLSLRQAFPTGQILGTAALDVLIQAAEQLRHACNLCFSDTATVPDA